MIHADFETRSKTNIWEVGAWVYSQDPSTEILCFAYAVDDGPVQLLTKDDIEMGTIVEFRDLLCAHNALFEQSIYQNILVKKFGWPRIPINRWRCTMAKALAHSLPQSLKECGKALNASVLKSDEGYRMMLKMCKPKEDGTFYEDAADFQKLYDYCINDVEAERAIDSLLPDLIPDEQNTWFLDQLINQRGVYVDKPAIQKAISFAEVHARNLNNIVEIITEGRVDRVSRRQATLDWCAGQGVFSESYTKDSIGKILSGDIPDDVRIVLDTKMQLGKTSVKKYQAMANSTCGDGRIRDLLIYHGASTGRWTGKLIQLQNLPKGNIKDTDTAIELLKQSSLDEFEIFYPDVMGALSSCIRGMITAAPGHQLIVADYAAIEARMVMWLAGEEYGLRQFREFDQGSGPEPYIVMAQNIYNRQDIPKKGNERALGKTAILGCGFGMGAPKFATTCANWGIEVTESLAKKAVETYRSLYPRVRDSWYAQERSAIKTVETRQRVDCGRVQWSVQDNNLLCKLPSGRSLVYNSASLEHVKTPWGEEKLALHFMAVDGETKKWVKEHTYGGKLVENITQAVARDIMARAMFRCEKAGYKIAFSVHDEIVSEVPMGFGSVKEFERLLCEIPQWGAGCPIVAKGFITTRYRKD